MQFQQTSPPYKKWIHAAAIALLAVCSCQLPDEAPNRGSPCNPPVDITDDTHRKRIKAIARSLRSDDWEKRYEILQELGAFGLSAKDIVLPLLEDKNEVVRKAAQNYFVSLGETSVPYLVRKLVNVEQDVGFYARIAGGKERHEIKSLAGTLWLTLVRGVPRDRCFEITQEMISSDSARIRAVGLFTAATMREVRFLHLLAPIAKDEDPMIKDRFWESLVLLLVKRSESAPDLDEVTCEQTLMFLEPELVPLLSSEKHGAVYTWQTYGSLLEDSSIHEKLRLRFISMLHQALKDDRLSTKGAVNAGAIIARQYKDDDLLPAFQEWVEGLELKKNDSSVHRQLAALSSFSPAAYDLEALPRLLDFADDLAAENRVEARGLPILVANILIKAITKADQRASQRAMESLTRWIAHEDRRFSFDTAIAHGSVLEEIEKIKKRTDMEPLIKEEQAVCEHQRKNLVASATKYADDLFARAESLSLQELFELEKLFVFIEDKRYLDLFEMVWSHRWDDRPGIHSITTRAMRLLADRQEKAILPHIFQCVEEPESEWHNKLRDGCVYSLTQNNRFGRFANEFLTPERLDRWIQIIQDPHLHNRTRAGFFPILEENHLSPEKRKALADLILRYTCAPHDSNQRSKAILSLGRSGDRRVLAPLYAMAMESDHPWWIWENLVPTLAKLHGAPQSEWEPEMPEGPVPKKAMEVLIDLLETQLATMKPYDEVRFAYPNNYFSWGIEYLIYPPEQTVYFMKKYTRQDFGMDTLKWRTWLSNQKDVL